MNPLLSHFSVDLIQQHRPKVTSYHADTPLHGALHICDLTSHPALPTLPVPSETHRPKQTPNGLPLFPESSLHLLGKRRLSPVNTAFPVPLSLSGEDISHLCLSPQLSIIVLHDQLMSSTHTSMRK